MDGVEREQKTVGLILTYKWVSKETLENNSTQLNNILPYMESPGVKNRTKMNELQQISLKLLLYQNWDQTSKINYQTCWYSHHRHDHLLGHLSPEFLANQDHYLTHTYPPNLQNSRNWSTPPGYSPPPYN